MDKVDIKKELKHLYRPSSKHVEAIDVPEMNFLSIDGEGGPNDPTFQEAIEALFSLSYTLKFMIKKGTQQIDYGVLPLEGLWWVDDMSKFNIDDKASWKWTLMIMQPDFITDELYQEAKEQLRKKKNPIALPKVKFSTFQEGKSAQILHIGPFSEEGPTVEKIHSYIMENGRKLSGKHHEIYLSDFRKVAPEKMKTIIRQPMK